MQVSDRLIAPDGEVRFGIFPTPIESINFRDYRLLSPLGRPASWWRRRFGFNQFTFLGALSEELVLGCALADIKYAGTAFVYLYRPATGVVLERSIQIPLARGVRFDQRPEDGCASYVGSGVSIEMSATPGARRLHAELPELSIDAHFDELHPLHQPLRICTRSGAAGWTFARKTAGMKVSGAVRWGAERFDLAALDALGHCDWTAGFMERETFWNWGCLAGRARDGRVVGLNVCCGVNDTGFTENCFWIDGVLHKIDTVNFDYDRHDLMKPWRLRSADGRLALEVEPQARHSENINAWLVASNFNQLIGRYRGQLRTGGDETVELDGVLGYAESHYAKW